MRLFRQYLKEVTVPTTTPKIDTTKLQKVKIKGKNYLVDKLGRLYDAQTKKPIIDSTTRKHSMMPKGLKHTGEHDAKGAWSWVKQRNASALGSLTGSS